MSSAHSIPEPLRKFTVEEYLALERAAEARHEYLDGEIIAMARDTEAMAGSADGRWHQSAGNVMS